MIWALLAAFLTKRPQWVLAMFLGLCTGLFVAAGAKANERNPLISSVVLLVLTVGVAAGVAFYLALRAQLRQGWGAGSAPPTWVNLAYASVWGAVPSRSRPCAVRRRGTEGGPARDLADRSPGPTHHRRD